MPPIPTGWGDRSFKDTLQFGKGKAPIYVGSDDEEDEGGMEEAKSDGGIRGLREDRSMA